MDGFIEEAFASALGGLAIAGILFDVGDHARIEHALPIVCGVVFQICTLPSYVSYCCPLVKEGMMVLIPVHCPHCQSEQVIKGGKTQVGTQRYKCQNVDCPHYSFQLDLTYKGRSPAIKERIIDMALNGSGIRDTARVLQISPTTVINELKKKRRPSAV
jgi:transposase-like protein